MSKRKGIDEEEDEYTGFHTVSTIVHDHVLLVDQGKGKDVLLHEINGEPRYPAAEISKRAGRVITKFIAKEDNRVQDFGTVQSASKEVRMPEEESPGAVSAPIVGPSRMFEPAPRPTEEKSILKNMIDNLQEQVNKIGDRIQSLNTHDKIIIAIATAGLVFGIVGFALGLR
jgi:hypothetical protein